MIKIDLHKTLKSSNSTFELDVKMSVNKGDFIAIYGESGAGKTTILRLIAGLDKCDSGNITIHDSVWYDSKINLKPQQRKVGMVFQDYALFPNMTVKENLEYALAKGDSTKIIDELIKIIELEELKDRKPYELSGGQKQRVSLARALVQRPDVLLLDEPLSALDDDMRFKLQDYILTVHKKYNLTTFIVTHDLAEVFKMTNYVYKLKIGKIVEEGTPESVFLKSNISGKYKTIGRILKIQKADIVNIVSVISGQNVIKVIATDLELKHLSIGEKVVIVSKAFNPILIKI